MGKDVDLVAFPNEEAMNWLIGLAKEAANKGYLYRIENDTLTIQIPAFEQYKGSDLATADRKLTHNTANPPKSTEVRTAELRARLDELDRFDHAMSDDTNYNYHHAGEDGEVYDPLEYIADRVIELSGLGNDNGQ